MGVMMDHFSTNRPGGQARDRSGSAQKKKAVAAFFFCVSASLGRPYRHLADTTSSPASMRAYRALLVIGLPKR